MLFGKREGRAPAPRSRRPGKGFRPRADRLEPRQLLTAIDLVNIANAPGPYGVQMLGLQSPGGAGFSVADVGDANGDGFDDFLIGAPTIDRQATTFPTLGTSNNSQAYLVFGSNAVNQTAVQNFLNLGPNDRAGDLATLGNSNQTNPFTGNPGFLFNGLTFQLAGVAGSQLGASVAAAGDVNGDGLADFLIGAPGSADPNNPVNVGAGRVFLVYGSTALSTRTNKIIDLGSVPSDMSVITFFTNQLNVRAGRSVAGLGDFLPDGIPDIAIGAPGAGLNGLNQSGAVFVIPGGFLRPARTQTVNLLTVGQPNGTPGIVFTGEQAGQGAGFSVAGPGDVDGASPGQPAAADLLIGAPGSVTGQPGTTSGPGQAYLIYGNPNLLNAPAVVSDFASITLDRINVPGATGIVPGAVFSGAETGDLTGYAVSTAGDFNGDGLADFLIGSPGFANLAGRADLIYGRSATPSPPGPIVGRFDLGNLPANTPFAEFVGVNPGDLAGLAVGATGRINNDPLNEMLIGAPGSNGASGAAFLVPGNANLFGLIPLDQGSIQNAPAFATVIAVSNPVAGNLLGSAVGGRTFAAGGFTMDSDSLGDFAIGAPGYSLSGRSQAGTTWLLEGAFIPLAIPVSQTVTSPIGIDGVRPPFVINATTPDDLPIFILSGGANPPTFHPFDDIDPTTITVNGVALPDPGTFTNVGDLDGDGVDDAGFIFSPRSDLNLTRATRQIQVQARTAAGSPLQNRRYQGTADVRVVTTPSGGGGGASLPPAFGGRFVNTNAAAPRFGERLVPSPTVIGRPRWKPLPPRLAYGQFLPRGAFGFRLRNYFHPDAQLQRHKGPTLTLGRNVFTRGRFPKGAFFGRINHHGPTVGQGNV